MIGAYGSELGRFRSDLIWSDLIDACGSKLGRSVLVDRCLIGSCLIGIVDWCFVTEMLWIRPRGRVDLCLGIEMGREIGIERESNKLEKMGRERERECVYVKGLVERNNKKN